MDTTENKKDIIEFKQAMEINPSAESGWEVVYDDPISKKYPGIIFAIAFTYIF
jgi:hypothetical protein